MAYEMQYHYKEINRESIKNLNIMNYISSVIVLLICTLLIHFGSSGLKMLLMGEWENAQNASVHMIESLKNGASFEDAIYTFCQVVLE